MTNTTTRLESDLATRRREGQKALVPFFTAGYPDEQTFLELLAAAARAGCQTIEVGIPFSDPVADGPVIQASSQHVLERGMTLERTLELTGRAAAATGAALVLMGYLNPILRMGLERFADHARAVGVGGVIVPDVPVEESAALRRVMDTRGIAVIDLVAKTSSSERIARIAGEAQGFLYLVSLTGVTGSQVALDDELDAFVAQVRATTHLPLFVGFGISGRDEAARAVEYADGVVIGSAIIRLIQSGAGGTQAVADVEQFLKDIYRTINTANPISRSQP